MVTGFRCTIGTLVSRAVGTGDRPHFFAFTSDFISIHHRLYCIGIDWEAPFHVYIYHGLCSHVRLL